jgi:lysophospholipase L1-like esterase
MRLPLRIILALVVLGVALPTLAKVLEVEGSDAPGALVCSNVAQIPNIPAPPPLDETTPPDLDELGDLMSAENALDKFPTPVTVNEPSGNLSIALWGDSHIAANFFSEELINKLSAGKYVFRPSFIPPTMGRGGVRLPLKKFCKSIGWSYSVAYTNKGEPNQFSPALIAITNNNVGANLALDFRFADNRSTLKELVILIKPSAEDLVIQLRVDNNSYNNITIPAGDDRILLKSSTPFSTMALSVQAGQITLEGFLPTYDAPPDFVVDTLGIPGATARAWKVIDPEYMKSKLPSKPYDVAILEYGTNEGADKAFDPVAYRESLSAELKVFKTVFPDTQCILMGPTDRGVLVKKAPKALPSKKAKGKNKKNRKAKPVKPVALPVTEDLLKYAKVHQTIAQIQSELAPQFECKFWNWQAAMGGPGGAYQWFYKKPSLMASDLTHLTVQGYQESARRFMNSIELGDTEKAPLVGFDLPD